MVRIRRMSDTEIYVNAGSSRVMVDCIEYEGVYLSLMPIHWFDSYIITVTKKFADKLFKI